jgi:N-acetylglucosaminyl-diphospho-decaprenol L-rhamnosyltransferase
MPDLSIVFTTWNSLSHIRKCIESILSLDMPDMETIVVDSNSTDGTREYLEVLSHSPEASMLGLKVLSLNRRVKWSEANQIGLDHSNGEWVCLSNPDIIFNECFPKMLESCSRSNALVVAPQLISQDGSPQGPMRLVTPLVFLLSSTRTGSLITRIARGRLPSYSVHYEWNGEDAVQVDNPVGSFFMVHRRVLKMFNGRLWNKGYLNGVSDLDAFLNFKKHGIPVKLFPSCRIVHSGSHVTKKDPSWIEYDQSFGIVLYFRYWKMAPQLSTIILGLEGFLAVPLEMMLKIARPRQSFFNPRLRAWKAGQRFLGLLDGWRFQIDRER